MEIQRFDRRSCVADGFGHFEKMLEGHEEEFPEAMLPLGEISDEAQLIELTKEILDFVAKAMAVHNCRVDEEMLSRALKPIFKDKEQEMIKTIFDEKYEAGVAEGKVEAILLVLKTRLGKVPKSTGDAINAVTNRKMLEKLTKVAAKCGSLTEFESALNQYTEAG